LSWITRATVAVETPARAATSFSLTPIAPVMVLSSLEVTVCAATGPFYHDPTVQTLQAYAPVGTAKSRTDPCSDH
jgi:hypothetical protein